MKGAQDQVARLGRVETDSAVSTSRISPTRITSGSSRRKDLKSRAKESLILGLTWVCMIPGKLYSMGPPR